MMRTALNFNRLASVISAALLLSLSTSEVAAQDLALPPALPGAPPALSTPTAPASIPTAVPGSPTAPATAATTSAPRVRIIEENGMRYQETRQMVRQPIQDVRYEERQQTGYQQRLRTDVQRVNYYTQVPITQYECVPRLYDWWRIFQGGYVAYGLEPYTTYQTQPQSSTIPVTRREVMPVTQTVKVAVPYLRFEEKEQVSRVALGPVNPTAPGIVAAPAPPLTPAYTPPTYIPPNIRPPGPGPGYAQPRPLFGGGGGGIFGGNGLFGGGGLFGNNSGSGVAAGGSVPSDPNPFGGWGGAASWNSGPTNGGILAPAPSYRPPLATPSPSPAPSAAPRVSTDDRYGGVARYDGDPPRYGARPEWTR